MTAIGTDGEVNLALVELGAETPRDEVKQRQGPGGKRLDYIDARFVFDRLDAAVGPANWQTQLFAVNGGMLAGIGIKLAGEWIWKWDGGDPSDIEGFKGQISDSIKRAAVQWGIARDLYGSAKPVRPAPSVAGTIRDNAQRTAVALAENRADELLDAQRRGVAPPPALGIPPEPVWQEPENVTAAMELAETLPQAVPVCPVHHKPMKPSTKFGGFYCTPRMATGGARSVPHDSRLPLTPSRTRRLATT